jgi:regulator of sigma E protease
MSTLLIFIIVLGILVFVHELGHFVVARRNGIKAEEFGFGFPPRMVGVVKNAETGKWETVWGNKEVVSPNTVYSLNWIPLGGFVRIKGEDGSQRDKDSFAVQSAWVRTKVLVAGVAMNFLLAWVFISIVLMAGFPQMADPNGAGEGSGKRFIQISEVKPNTPAEAMGLQFGDVIQGIDGKKPANVEQVQKYIADHKGREIVLQVERGKEKLTLAGVPRTDYPEGEGSLGIALGETEIVRYPWYQAIWEGARTTYGLTLAILGGLFDLLKSLLGFESAMGLEGVSGPVGIAHLTKQVSELGLVYLMYFTAILSINLGIINILPIPALDGGRVLFVLIEVLKGSPVSQRIEGLFHQFGFIALLLLMVLVTVHDLGKFRLFERLFGG